MRKGYH